jgi:hypothetical protein
VGAALEASRASASQRAATIPAKRRAKLKTTMANLQSFRIDAPPMEATFPTAHFEPKKIFCPARNVVKHSFVAAGCW